MKKWLIYAGIFLIGSGAGAISSSLYFKKKYKAEYIDKANQLIDDYRRYLVRQKTPKDVEEFDKKVDESKEVHTTDPKPQVRNPIYDIQVDLSNAMKYRATAQKTEPKEPEVDEIQDIPETESFLFDDDVTDRHPLIFTDPNKVGEISGWDTEELTYYAGDGVLVDGDGEIVDIVTMFGELVAESPFWNIKNTFFIRAYDVSTDYQIIAVKEAYSERD